MNYIFQPIRQFSLLIVAASYFSYGYTEEMDHSKHDGHAMHRAMMNDTQINVVEELYILPDVSLTDRFGKNKNLKSLLNSKKLLAVNFIFTTCTTICPVMTATFSQVQRKLGEDSQEVAFVSITIDPEYDRPKVLKEYADNFYSNSDWTFLTGQSNDIFKVTKSFKAYSGSKMNHRPVTFLKRPNEKSWSRIEGLVNATRLTQEIKKQLL